MVDCGQEWQRMVLVGVSSVGEVLGVEVELATPGHLVTGSRGLPGCVCGDSGGGWPARRICGQFLAQLENGQPHGYDEGEETQLKRVPRLQAQGADKQRNQRHGFQQHEHHDGDDDLLQPALPAWKGQMVSSYID